MPRDRRAPAAVATRETNSLVASATWYSGKQERLYLPPKDWQRECYRHYSICGEARAAAQYYGNALSRCNLGIAKRDREGNLKAAKSGEAVRVLKALADGCGGQSQLMKSVGVHMCIAGECYIVGRKVNGADTWEVVSVIEMEVSGQNVWSINYHDGKPPVALGENDPVIRVWHQHPEKKIEADSPFRSMLPILREIEWTTRHVFSQVTSRLAGAGLLLLPNGATFPAPPAMEGEDPTGQTTTEEIHGIMRVLADTMMIPLSNPDSPAARVPIVIKVPDESVDKIKLLHFWSELDDKVLEIRNNDILRFARGMDLPQEQIMGMSSNPGTGGGASNGVSHWGAWQIEESTIKMFIEPMCEMIASALTLQYLR